MQLNLAKLAYHVTLGIALLFASAAAPSFRLTENHTDSSGNSSGPGNNLNEHHSYLSRFGELSRRDELKTSTGSRLCRLNSCPKDGRVRRALLTVSGHKHSGGHRLANFLLAPMLT